jgi:hypothetical protein
LSEVLMPGSITSIGNEAFKSCHRLTNATIPNRVTSIGEQAFADCPRLVSVTIPGSVAILPKWAFEGCSSLRNLVIQDGVTTIQEYAFASCRGLKNLTIPASVSYIWKYAFFGCSGLTSIYFEGNAPGFDVNAFASAPAIAYYLPWTRGWDNPQWYFPTTVPWLPLSPPDPLILDNVTGFGIQQEGFSLVIVCENDISVVVEACTDPANPAWVAVDTNTLASGWSYFSDPDWSNHSSRFYRIRSP